MGVTNQSQTRSDLSGKRLNLRRLTQIQQAGVSTSFSQNAVAGGVAGSLVSFCLHPVDTLKTVLQADVGMQRQSIQEVYRTFESRGFLSLYKGLGANLVTAAPISAIYASTYEGVKEFLVPRLPQNWLTLAHCMAGGAASVATSVVYTPSEAIKQRMQIGSHYKTSLGALFGIIRSEGILSLYSGIGAVLCRNIPQSIIKFWAYEALKKKALDKQKNKESLKPATQLLIGGIAGSTAAFVTTPFDVIKTRMQTQAVGSVEYISVSQAFTRILSKEGISGLYRGLVPRLAIYMSQGAIFFASYELLKFLLKESSISLRVSQATRKRTGGETDKSNDRMKTEVLTHSATSV